MVLAVVVVVTEVVAEVVVVIAEVIVVLAAQTICHMKGMALIYVCRKSLRLKVVQFPPDAT